MGEGDPVWYLTEAGERRRGQVAHTFLWDGQPQIVIADRGLVVRDAMLVADRADGRIGFSGEDDELDAEIADIVGRW